MDAVRTVSLLVAISASLLAQPAPNAPEFEVASVKPSPATSPEQMSVGLHIDGAQVHVNYLSLKDYIRIAYRVKDYQIAGPEWMASERYDLDAKLPAGASRDKIPEMLQALLADRFQVKLHRESKEFAVYALATGSGGAKLKQSPADAEADAEAAKAPLEAGGSGSRAGVNISLGRGSSFSFANDRMEGKKMTMETFAEMLARFVDRPVIDTTDLKGNYDFSIELTPDDFRNMLIRSAIKAGVTLPAEARRLVENVGDDSLFAALRLLGLKLDTRKAPLELLVIDRVQKAPTAN